MDLAGVALADRSPEREITLLAVSVSHLGDEAALHLELPLGVGEDQRRPGTAAGSAPLGS